MCIEWFHTVLVCKKNASGVRTGEADPEGEANCNSQRQNRLPSIMPTAAGSSCLSDLLAIRSTRIQYWKTCNNGKRAACKTRAATAGTSHKRSASGCYPENMYRGGETERPTYNGRHWSPQEQVPSSKMWVTLGSVTRIGRRNSSDLS